MLERVSWRHASHAPTTPQRHQLLHETVAQRKRAHIHAHAKERARGPGARGKACTKESWSQHGLASLLDVIFRSPPLVSAYFRTYAQRLLKKKNAEAGEALALRRISQRRERLAGEAGADLGWELGVIEEAMSIWKRTL